MKEEKFSGCCPGCGSHKVREEQERAYCCLSKKPDPDYRSCGLRSVNMDKANEVVWNLVSELTRNSERLRKLIQSQLEPQEVDQVLVSFELEAIDKEVRTRELQIEALLRSQEVLEQPYYVKRTIENLHKEKEDLLSNKRRLEAERACQELQRQRVDWIERAWKKIGSRLETMTDQERFDFLHAFLIHVQVDYDEKARIHLFEPVVAIELDESVPLPESLQEQLASV